MSTDAQASPGSAGESNASDVNLLDMVVTATRPQNTQEAERARDYFKQFLEHAIKPGQLISKDVETNIKNWIGEIDKKLSSQLNEIMHAPEFQKLEGTWRGLHYFVHQSETGTNLKIRVLNVTKRELFKDLEKAVEFDQSALFKKI